MRSRRSSLPSWQPVAPESLADRLTAWLAATPGVLRVALDGHPSAEPDELAARLVAPLRAIGRPAAHIAASLFWRDASVRLEHGRQDVESYRSWLDADALRREVLEPAVASGTYLPSLRDPQTNRSTRKAAQLVAADQVLIISGSLLLGRGLPFDRTIHLTMSAAARTRRTPAVDAWTLPAYDAYEAEVHPVQIADVAIKLDDPLHPAALRL